MDTTFVKWNTTTDADDDVFPLFKVSFHFYTVVGTLVVIVVGLVASFLTGAQDPASIDPDLISPTLHRWVLPPKEKRIPIKSTHRGGRRPSEGVTTATAAATTAPLIQQANGVELKDITIKT